MKRLISAILISCFLSQLFGCYSTREISLEELQNTDNVILTTNDSTVYYLKRDVSLGKMLYSPDVFFATEWIVKQDSERIVLITQKAARENIGGSVLSIRNKDTTNINYKDINNIAVETVDTENTILAVVLTLVGILGIAATVFALTFRF